MGLEAVRRTLASQAENGGACAKEPLRVYNIAEGEAGVIVLVRDCNQNIMSAICDEEVSIGDEVRFVLSGKEDVD